MIWLILTLGLILRLINLNQSLWLDEAVQAVTAQGSLAGIFSELQGDFHPPLYHLLLWIWVHLFGSSEIILRLPSVLFGVVTIYVVYLIVRQFIGYKFPIPEIAALFLATAPFHVYYSQEARPYALVTFLTVCSMYFFLKQKWLGYILSTILALYSSYFVFFVILAQVIFLFLKKQFSLYRYLVISLLFFLPWLPMFLIQLEVGQQAVSLLPEWGRLVNVDFFKALPLTFIKFSIGRISIFDKAFYILIAGTLFMVYGGIIMRVFFQKNKFPISTSQFPITLWLVIPILFAWSISFFIPNYQPFRLLLVLPAFYLLLTLGINQFSAKVVRIVLVIFVILVNLISLGTYYTNSYFHREDWRGVVRFIESQDKPGITLLPSSTSDWPWRYYSLGRTKLIGVSSGARMVEDQDLTKSRVNQSQIYYIRYLQPLFDPQEKIISWLTVSGYVKIREVSFNQIPVWEYAFLK